MTFPTKAVTHVLTCSNHSETGTWEAYLTPLMDPRRKCQTLGPRLEIAGFHSTSRDVPEQENSTGTPNHLHRSGPFEWSNCPKEKFFCHRKVSDSVR